MKFDSNLAWKQASSAVSANRDVLLALSGVFFLLPSLAFALFLSPPQPAAGQNETQMLAAMQQYYASVMPYLIPVLLFQATGTLAMLTLFTDRSRPTVGQAIKLGFAGILSFIAAQLLLGMGVMLIGGTLVGIAAATGVQVLAVLVAIAVVLAAIYAAIKVSLVAPVVAVERVRNPFTALARSWRLTSGNSLRIGLFYLLLLVVFLVLWLIIVAVTVTIVSLLAGDAGAKIAEAVVSSVIGAVMTLYSAAVAAAVHRQLAGPSPEAASAPFE